MHQQYHLTKSMLPTVQPFWQGRSVFHSLILVYEVSFPTNQPKHPLHCPSPYSQQSFSHMPLSKPMDLWCFHLFAILGFGGLLLTKPPQKPTGFKEGALTWWPWFRSSAFGTCVYWHPGLPRPVLLFGFFWLLCLFGIRVLRFRSSILVLLALLVSYTERSKKTLLVLTCTYHLGNPRCFFETRHLLFEK